MGIYDTITYRTDDIEAEIQVKWMKRGFDGYDKCACRIMMNGDHAPRGVPDGRYSALAILTIHSRDLQKAVREFYLDATVTVRNGWTKVRINDPIPPQYARHMQKLNRSIEQMEAKLAKSHAKELTKQ